MLLDDSQIDLVCALRMMLFLWHIRDEDPIERKDITALAGMLPPAQAMFELRKDVAAAGGDRVDWLDWMAKNSSRRKKPFAINFALQGLALKL